MNLIPLLLLLPVAAAGVLVYHNTKQSNLAKKKARDRAEQLNCARVVWPHCTMSDDGVIHVDMALEDRARGFVASPPLRSKFNNRPNFRTNEPQPVPGSDRVLPDPLPAIDSSLLPAPKETA